MSSHSTPSPRNRPIRIARVLTRPGVGGAARHVGLLTQGLDAQEWDIRLYCGPPRTGEGDFFALHRAEFAQLRTIQIPSLRREAAPSRDLRALIELVRHFKQWKPDLVDTHLSKAGFIGRLAARLANVPAVVHTFHINIFEGYDWRPGERELYLALERIAARWSDRLICLSNELTTEFINLGIGHSNQYRTIELGIDLSAFNASPEAIWQARKNLRAELGLPSHTPLVGLICRLAPVKSVKTALEAAQLLGSDSPIHWVIAGEGESRERLQALAQELKVADRVHFLGLRSDIAALNLALDAIALTSLQEGTPISLIESLAAARPVVATDVGGVSRLIQHRETGLLIPPRDARALATGISEIFADPEAAKARAIAGREKMQREFGLERMLERHCALYREILAEKFLH